MILLDISNNEPNRNLFYSALIFFFSGIYFDVIWTFITHAKQIQVSARLNYFLLFSLCKLIIYLFLIVFPATLLFWMTVIKLIREIPMGVFIWTDIIILEDDKSQPTWLLSNQSKCYFGSFCLHGKWWRYLNHTLLWKFNKKK